MDSAVGGHDVRPAHCAFALKHAAAFEPSFTETGTFQRAMPIGR